MAHRGGGNYQRQRKHWHSIITSPVAFVGDATSLHGSFSLNDPATVLRMLGELSITATSAPTASDQCFITHAIGVVSTDAAGVGASAMPDPAAEPDYPWLAWWQHSFFFSTADLGGGDAARSVRQAFDIRSMRKMKPRESLVVVSQYEDSAGTPAMNVAPADVRVLFGE